MKLTIEGMHCQNCVEHVRNAIHSIDGARAEHVELGSATVSVDASKAAQVIAAIRDAGYGARQA